MNHAIYIYRASQIMKSILRITFVSIWIWWIAFPENHVDWQFVVCPVPAILGKLFSSVT